MVNTPGWGEERIDAVAPKGGVNDTLTFVPIITCVVGFDLDQRSAVTFRFLVIGDNLVRGMMADPFVGSDHDHPCRYRSRLIGAHHIIAVIFASVLWGVDSGGDPRGCFIEEPSQKSRGRVFFKKENPERTACHRDDVLAADHLPLAIL